MATWQDFNGLNLITDAYKRSVAQSLLINELGPVSNGYTLENAVTGRSGWSFGGQQMDLTKSTEGLALLKDIVTYQYGESYWTTSLKNGLTTANNINSLTVDQKTAINIALSSDYGKAKIDANFVTAIDSITRYVDKIEIELQKINPDLALSSGEKLMLIDFKNQYGLSLDNTVPNSMLKKLQDEVARSGDLTPESIKELFKTTTYYEKFDKLGVDNPQERRLTATYNAAITLDSSGIVDMDTYTIVTEGKFQLTADYFGMTLNDIVNANPNLDLEGGYALLKQGETLLTNDVEMNFLSNGNVLVDSNGDYYIIQDTVIESTSEDMAFAIQLKDVLDNNRTDLAKLQFSNLRFASNDENGTWMTYLRAKQVSSVESSIFALESALNSTDVSIVEDASGKFNTIKANGNTFVITDHGQIIQYDTTTSKVFVVTGQYTESSYTITSSTPISDELLGSIAEALSTSSTTTLPEGFNGSIVLSSSDNQISLSSIKKSDGEIIGTLKTFQEEGVQTITQSFNDTSLPVQTTVITDDFTATFSDNVFQGFSSVGNVAVSEGFNKLFLENLHVKELAVPSLEEIKQLNLNDTTNTNAIKEAYDTTVESSVSVTDYYGTPKLITQTEATLQTIGTGIASLTDALSLIKAIQSGQPLPIVATGIRLAADLDYIDGVRDMPNLAAASSIASGILSIMSLSHALENGDSIGAVTAGANALYLTASGYAVLSSSSTEVAKALSSTFETTGGALNSLGEALPYLNIVNSIAHGDAVGVGVSVASYWVPYVGWAYAVYSIIDSLFGGDEIPDPWGNGKYVWDGNGISYQSAGETGGNEAVRNVMSNVLAVLNNLIEQQRLTNPTSALGIIPNRMPTIAYDMSGYRYTDIDPLTGVEKHAYLRYDTQGNPYNATPGSDESYQSIIEAMVRSALTRSAIAPLWEVQTAKMQTDAGDPKAGLTEEARAGRDGVLASSITGATQTFRPVTLDLSGNGQIDILSKESANVNFDVDDSGFLKDTAWIDGGDAFLTLDRDYNGETNTGKEMFSNAAVAIGRRGLAGMAWVDANYDGKITSLDPVWNELRVWQDENEDGIETDAESHTLSDLGITELNYAMGTFTQNGTVKKLSSPDLEADAEGSRINVVPEGIIVETSQGDISLLVTRIDDQTAVEANQDGISGYEDVEMIIASADLLNNDLLGGFSGRDLSLSAVGDFQHGSGFIDANGFVHFIPEANYAGSDASFTYTVTAQNGQTGTGTVKVSLQGVNDAPTLDHVEHTTKPLYGYNPVWYDYEYGSYSSGGEPIYTPYSGHTNPLWNEDTGQGKIIGTDVDNAAGSLTYELINAPQYGSLSIDAQGNYTYVSWKEPGVPSDRIIENGQYGALKDGTLYTRDNLPGQAVYPTSDVFQVKITDPSGASTIQSITVPHYGPYLPPTPPGGGGKKPIAIDLAGDGFNFVNVNDSNVFFDVTGDGWKRKTAWVGADDGILAFDSNNNGKIETANEISFVGYKEGSQTDLEGLKAFDSNGDGLFDASDEKWNQFGIWQDANQNGITDEGEFKTLSDMGIASMSLSSDGRFSVINKQTVHGIGSMNKTDGSTLAIADVTLEYSNETQLPGTQTSVSSPSPFSADGEVLEGTAEKDLILGKNGNNIVNAYGGDDVVFEDGGNDIVYAAQGNDIVYTGADNDLVFAGEGDDIVYAGKGDDILFGEEGNDVLFAESGNDIVFAGEGNDFLSGGEGNDVLSGDAGNDELYGESGNDALFGQEGDDKLVGLDGFDRLDGGAGNDMLDGGADADEMLGGSGNDTYVVDNAEDSVLENANEGIDTVNSSMDYTLGDTLENLTLLGTQALHGVGNASDNTLVGNSSNNILEGKEGNDILNGGLGADTLIGGMGDDIYTVDNRGDVVVEAEGEGEDTIYASVDYTIASSVEKLVLTGYASINATGNNADNILVGNTASNILDGGLGVDIMSGGKGDDTYIVDNVIDQVIEASAEGIDTIKSTISWTLGANTENLFLTGNEAIDATGNTLNNILVGNSATNILDGGLGADAMAGGLGDDVYYVDALNDHVVEKVGEGIDSVYASVSYTTAANVENLTLLGQESIHAYGNELDNLLVGNNASNILDGKAGVDTLMGHAGDDTYYVDSTNDCVLENLDEGVDSVIASANYTLSAQVENLTLSGSENLQGEGNELNNILVGNVGANILDGKEGSDAMMGGLGDDTYYVDNEQDSVVENATEGYDTIFSTVTYTASSNVERLELLGVEAINGYGNEHDNVLIGNSAANFLDGKEGSDTMIGAQGDDTYIVAQEGDVLIELEEEGTDQVFSSVSYTLSQNVEHLTLVGEHAYHATGNNLANTLIGNALDNTLDGKEGSDRLIGGAGHDTYYVDNESDTVIEQFNEGLDTIYSSVSYVLPEHVENLIMIGDGANSVGGNSANNTLMGNSANNYLYGGAGDDYIDAKEGNDTLEGATGNDMLLGGSGNDTYIYNVGDGLDKIVEVQGDDTVAFTQGLSLNNVALRITNTNGSLMAQVRILNEGGCEQANQGFDFAVSQDAYGRVISPIEHFSFADGSMKTFDDMLIKTQVTYASSKQTSIITGRNDDIIYGSSKSNVIFAGSGNDIVYAYSGNDFVYGEGGNDVLYGNTNNDTLDGGCGTDILRGSNGYDYLKDSFGNNALMGGYQDDRLEAGSGNDFLSGGAHDDLLNGGAGYNVFVFNKGDGHDTILPASGAHNTLSLGDIDSDDITLRKQGNDLLLDMGSNSEITLKNWYSSVDNQNFDTLQLVSSTYEYHFDCFRMRVDEKPSIETFDFHALVDAFDTARTSNPRLNSWNAMNGLLNAHLSTSETLAIGGDLAWDYARNGDITNVSLASTQTILQNPTFGASAQTLNPKDLCHY